MKTSIFKKGVSVFMAMLMCLSALVGIGTTTAFAAGTESEVYMISYPRDGDANYGGTWGHGNLQYMNGWSSGSSNYTTVRAMGTFESNICYCIEPGVPLDIGDRLTDWDENFWDNYPSSYNNTITPDDIKLFIGRIMQYGYTGTISTGWRSQNEGADKLAHAVATQLLIWETVVGERDADFNKVSTGGYDAVLDQISADHPLRSQIMSYYNSIAASVQTHSKLPSFFARSAGRAQNIELEWDGEKYTATLTDSNNVLGGYSFQANKAGIRFSVNGNKLTITADEAPSGTVSITASKSNSSRRGVITWSDGKYGPNKSTLQDVVTYAQSVSDPITGYLNIKVSYGSAKIVKTSEDGKVDGIKFRVQGNGIDKTVTTNAAGEIQIDNLAPGTYTVTEQTYDKYEPQESRQVVVVSGRTATVTFNNILRRGDLIVTKTAEDGLTEGIKFHLSGTSLSGIAVDEYAVTDSAGKAYFNDVLISNKNADSSNIRARTTYGTSRVNAYHIFEQTLNQKDVRVFDKVVDENGDERRVLNKKETAIAQDRQELIKAKFAEWIWKDIDRRELLCRIYNETFNSIRPREYDGQHIRFYGMNPEITLRTHQINAIAHVMYGGNTLLAHEVGAGKTFEMVAAAMEMKRLGLCTKSLIVVPNHITEQWAAEWLQLYPSANILVATKKDFERQNRRKFCGRIATGDYDAIIIGHSQFEKIPMSKERQEMILQQQISDIIFAIQEAKSAKAERYTVKQMEKTKKSLETRLARLNDQSRKDDVVTFEELGIDRLFIDESHYFKNLFLMTKMRNVGGIAQTEAQKSSDLFMKCQYLDEITGNRGVIFATGTPISNSMVELYTIQRYLQYDLLQEMGMGFFDDWAANFGETITSIELSPEGTGYRAKTRFAKFFNLPELMSTFKMVADIQTADMLKLPVPKANFHTEVIKPSPLQQEMIKGLAERAERIRAGGVDPRINNMLRITNDGRKLALDMRLIQPLAPDDENGKVAVCAGNVFRIWEQTQQQRSAQLVFCDLSTPKGDGSFNVYDDLKKRLMEKGIPEDEIAYIHDANTEARKKELFSRVRTGQVRVLIGSTQKMGAGTNVQDRLIALHDLDCPWRPSDLSQRLGRIVRQGNQNPEVEIYRYVTENTFDAYLYQLVENKQKFIAQIMTSKAPVRAAEDVDETALSYSEIKALATGNPLIIEKCNLDMEVAKLNMLKASYLSQKYTLEDMVLRKYPEAITRLKERIAGYEQDIQLVQAHPKPKEDFVGMEIDGRLITDKEEAGKAILDVCTKMTGSDAVALGKYWGFSLVLAYNGASNEYRMTMKGTLSHTIVLGADVFGNITRMDNALEGFEAKLTSVRAELADTEKQLASAREELEAPFAKEEELAKKTERLKELNILLNMDQKDRSLLDDEPEEEPPDRPRPRDYTR